MSKVTKEAINAKITDVSFIHLPGTTVTICSITLENGYSVRGESACVDPAGYVESVGRDLAYQNAFDKIWPLEGYLLVEQRHLAKNAARYHPVSTMPTLPEWQQRVVDEEQALNDKLQKLLTFQITEQYGALTAKAKSLLCRQANAMHDYADALKCRIEMF